MSVYNVTTLSGFEFYQIRVHNSIIVCSIQTHCELMFYILMTHMCTWKKSTTMQCRLVVHCKKYILIKVRKLHFDIRISTITCINKWHLCKLVFYAWIQYRGDGGGGGVKYCCADKYAQLILILAQFNIVYIGVETTCILLYISNLFEYISDSMI